MRQDVHKLASFGNHSLCLRTGKGTEITTDHDKISQISRYLIRCCQPPPLLCFLFCPIITRRLFLNVFTLSATCPQTTFSTLTNTTGVCVCACAIFTDSAIQTTHLHIHGQVFLSLFLPNALERWRRTGFKKESGHVMNSNYTLLISCWRRPKASCFFVCFLDSDFVWALR